MKDWPLKKVGDICEFKYGKNLPEATRVAGSYPVYGSSSIVSYHSESLVKGPGIIVGRKGTVGKVQFSKGDFFPIDTTFYIATKASEADMKFLYYRLGLCGFQDMNSDAAVPGLNRSAALSVKLKVPPLITQLKISDILSAYDDLIENNLKRIKLLEEMAQVTYEEWFVRMRFPGHESSTINPATDLPQGWRKVKLGDVCLLTMGQSPKSEFYNFEEKGFPFHQGVKDYGDRFPTNACWSTSGTRYAERGDVLFSVRAPVGRLNIALEKMILGRGLAAIRHKQNAQGFLYCLLKKQFFEEDMMGGGAIFNSVTKNDMHRIDVVEPSLDILDKYNLVNATDREIEILHSQNVRLREARDILLPRLMTGVIDVDELMKATA